MQMGCTFSQWQAVVTAMPVKPTKVYAVDPSDNVTEAGIVEFDLACSFTGTLPTEAQFLAAFPQAVRVNAVSSP